MRYAVENLIKPFNLYFSISVFFFFLRFFLQAPSPSISLFAGKYGFKVTICCPLIWKEKYEHFPTRFVMMPRSVLKRTPRRASPGATPVLLPRAYPNVPLRRKRRGEKARLEFRPSSPSRLLSDAEIGSTLTNVLDYSSSSDSNDVGPATTSGAELRAADLRNAKSMQAKTPRLSELDFMVGVAYKLRVEIFETCLLLK